jgi:hypothetical protein
LEFTSDISRLAGAINGSGCVAAPPPVPNEGRTARNQRFEEPRILERTRKSGQGEVDGVEIFQSLDISSGATRSHAPPALALKVAFGHGQ